MNGRILCRVLTGPTASGKSELAMRLALEEGWDILFMDSMQIYRGMDIGTAKPTAEERSLVPHHLLDLCNPMESFSVSRYVKAAETKIRELHAQGRCALFVGGTGLYLEAMMKPLGMGFVPADQTLRNELHELASGPEGRLRLDGLLRKLDPETADRLPLNDVRRRIRAIEVTKATGIPFSHQEDRMELTPFDWNVVSTETERESLYSRVNRRVDRMISAGLPEEVKTLLEAGVPDDAQSMQAIGYKEMIPYLRGEYSLEQAADRIRVNSRHYAKRQITFLKRLDNIVYVPAGTNQTYTEIKRILKGGVS